MTRTERVAAARALYAERKHFGRLPADAPDRLAALQQVRQVEHQGRDRWVNVVDCVCELTVSRWGFDNHLRSGAHIAGVFRLPLRAVVSGLGSKYAVSKAERRAERMAS